MAKKPKGFGKFNRLMKKLVKVPPNELRDATIEALIDAAFSVLAHDVGRGSVGEAKDAFDTQSAALRDRFRKILED